MKFPQRMSVWTSNSVDWTVPSVALTILLICVAAFWHLLGLGNGALTRIDEFYTYERTLGFSRMGDWWAVYSLGEPSLKKPPLQYWMSAAFIEAGASDTIALRLPSALFAVGCLFATAALARVMFPWHPLAMPAAVALLSTSDQFWRAATTAMLDSGAAFFSTLGIVAVVLALRDDRYWWTFTVAVFLAGLQKAPTPLAWLFFGLCFVAAFQKFHGTSIRDVLSNRRFKRSVLLAAILGFAWQIFQEIRFFGADALAGNIEQEMFRRFSPSFFSLVESGIANFDRLIFQGEPWIRLIGFLGLAILPFLRRKAYLFAAAGIAFLFVVAMMLASGAVYPRYSLIVLPLLCVGAAGLVFEVTRIQGVGLAVTIALCLAVGGPFRDESALGQSLTGRYDAPIEDILGPLNEVLEPGEELILCAVELPRIPPGAVRVFVPNSKPGLITYFRGPDNIHHDLRRYGGGRVRGTCPEEEFKLLEPFLRDYSTEPGAAGFVQWQAREVALP